MKTIKELLPKPSDALQAMVDGLLRQNNNPKFQIDMGTFGDTNFEKDICFGCAATCTLIEATGITVEPSRMDLKYGRAIEYGLGEDDIYDFEGVMEQVRTGGLSYLLKYYNVPAEVIDSVQGIVGLPYLSTKHWIRRVYELKEAIRNLRELHL